MREKNPTMVGGQKKKLVMKPPQVVRVGAKKTSFVNFTDICKMYVWENVVVCGSVVTTALFLKASSATEAPASLLDVGIGNQVKENKSIRWTLGG